MRWLGAAVLLLLVPFCGAGANHFYKQGDGWTAALASLTAIMLSSAALELVRRRRK